MSSVIDSVGWGKSALRLLSQCKKLDPKAPAVMHIRHTERPEATSADQVDILLSTDEGKRAAYEFGQRLPHGRVYRLYHSPSPRAVETAQQISEGLCVRGGAPQVKGVFLSSHIDREKFFYYMERDCLQEGRPDARQFFISLLSERYPPWEIEPPSLFAKRHAAIMVENLKTAPPNGLDVYVSHDVYIFYFLFYWFSIMPDDRIDYLDGFILQLKDDEMRVYTRDVEKSVKYPYWWRFFPLSRA